LNVKDVYIEDENKNIEYLGELGKILKILPMVR